MRFGSGVIARFALSVTPLLATVGLETLFGGMILTLNLVVAFRFDVTGWFVETLAPGHFPGARPLITPTLETYCFFFLSDSL